MYKVRSYVQHIATKTVCRIIKRRWGYNGTHYRLKPLNGMRIAETNWLSEDNVNEFYTRLDAKIVKVLYNCK